MRKERMIVLDTETANALDCALVYDLGWAVVDKSGKVYESHSYAISETFNDCDTMNTAYYARKVPSYWAEIARKERKLVKFATARKRLLACIKRHHITTVYAHNMRFDCSALNNTIRYLTASKERFFFPYEIQLMDTLKGARQALKDNADYTEFCKANNYMITDKAPRFTAEILYRYITNNNDFREVHKGIDDVMIEKEIMCYCYKIDENVDMRWGVKKDE